MVGLVGQDALCGGQGHRIFVDYGVAGAGLAVFGHLEQGIDATAPIMSSAAHNSATLNNTGYATTTLPSSTAPPAG